MEEPTKKLKIIKYGADWCGPCRTMSKVLKSCPYPFEEVSIDEHPEVIDQKSITTIPVLEIVDEDNKVLFSHTGPMTREELDSTWQLLIAKGVVW